MAGAFAGCRALVFGHCTRCPEPCDDDGRRTLDAVVAEAAALLGVPAAAGVPVGHIDDQWTLPFGADAEVTVEAGACRLHVAWPPA
jgi:muramoyltetrapeptide carboxypeptidase